MKSKMNRVLIALTLCLTTGHSLATFADGGVAGGGGDNIEAEFRAIARTIADESLRQQKRPISIDRTQFLTVVESTSVESTTEKLFVGQTERDALNFPDLRKIRVNISRWNLIEGELRKRVLAFHEYLGIMGVPDKSYEVSAFLLGLAQESSIVHPENIIGKPGSGLFLYDADVQKLTAMDDTTDDGQKNIIEASKAIIKKYFGISEVIVRNSSYHSGYKMARMIASGLRKYLPFDINTNSFLRVDAFHLSPDSPSLGWGLGNDGKTVLEIDADESGSAYREEMKRMTLFGAKQPVCTLTVGNFWSGIFNNDFLLKTRIVELINCSGIQYAPNVDPPLFY